MIATYCPWGYRETGRRHAAIGVIVYGAVGNGVGLDVLDAVAELMIQHAKTRQYYQNELRLETREVQRGVNDAYQQGRQDAARQDW